MAYVPRLLLACCIVATPAVCQYRGDERKPTDVPFDHYAYDAITWLISWEVVRGYPDGTFRPDASMTRYEFAAAWAGLVRLEPWSELRVVREAKFSWDGVVTDVPQGHWARDAVGELAAARLIIPDLRFRDVDSLHWAASPTEPTLETSGAGRRYLMYQGERSLLRGELAEVLYRMADLRWKDGIGRPLSSESAIQWGSDEGLWIGWPDGTFRPNRPLSRAEFCMAVARLLDEL